MKARLAGLNGMKMSRAAFALLIKFSDMVEDFLSLVDQVQFFCECEADKSNDLVAINNFLKELPQYEFILKKWEQASKMREWINTEKRKDLALKYEKAVRDEVIARKQKEEKEAAEAKAEKGEEKIDSSDKKEEESKDAKKPKETLTQEEKDAIQNEADDRVEKQLQEIFQRIQLKSEFLLKLQIPL